MIRFVAKYELVPVGVSFVTNGKLEELKVKARFPFPS
jgi:hypothetical protein